MLTGAQYVVDTKNLFRGAISRVKSEQGVTPYQYMRVEKNALQAIRDRKCDLISTSMKTPAILSIQYSGGKNLLHLVAESGSKRLTKIVSGYVFSKDVDDLGQTPLHSTVKLGKVKPIHFLTEKEQWKNKPDFQGNTPLHIAAQHGKSECVRELLSHGASRECQNNAGKTPLVCAIEAGDLVSVNLLAEGDMSLALQRPLWVCVDSGQFLIMRKLAEKYPTLAVCPKTKETILEYSANRRNETAISESLNIPSMPKLPALVGAIQNGNQLLVTKIIEGDTTVRFEKNDSGQGVVHISARYGLLECLKYLYKRDKAYVNKQINSQDMSGKTPLHYAVIMNQFSVVQWIVDKIELAIPDTSEKEGLIETQLGVRDNEGNTVLHYAFNDELYVFLAGSGARSDIANNLGEMSDVYQLRMKQELAVTGHDCNVSHAAFSRFYSQNS